MMHGQENIEYRHIVAKYSNIKFHENLSSGSRVVPCGQTDRRTAMTKLIFPFRNFANAPNNVKTDLRQQRSVTMCAGSK